MVGFLVLVSCGSDISVTKESRCDGIQNAGESYVDAPFDRDGDGFFDIANPDCQTTYEEEQLDCGDADAAVHPQALEVTCNRIDDDCDELTPDSIDQDQDGVDACFDCNDLLEQVFPDNVEVCDDGVDNDCDEIVDEDCAPPPDTGTTEVEEDVTRSGTYLLDAPIGYTCAMGYVSISVSTLVVLDSAPTIIVSSTGAQPGTMNGFYTDDNAFQADHTLPGSCTETYAIVGSFQSDTEFTGTLTATYTGTGSMCLDCTNQTWSVSGTKVD